MKSKEKESAAPIADEQTKPTDSAEPVPPAKPIDAKEEARRRSKEDLARKRRELRKGGGRF